MRNLSLWFPTKRDSNQSPQLQIQARKEVLAIRRIFSLVEMITNTKFSNCPNVFKKKNSKLTFYVQKYLSATLSECQTVWIQIMTDVLSLLIWDLTVCKGYQQTTQIGDSKKMFKAALLQHVL